MRLRLTFAAQIGNDSGFWPGSYHRIIFLKRGGSLFFCIGETMAYSAFSLILHFIYARKKTRKILSVLKNSHIYRPEARSVHRWTGKPRPDLPSGEDCCKQSDPEQFKLSVGHNGCKSVRGSKTPSTSGTREHSSRYHEISSGILECLIRNA